MSISPGVFTPHVPCPEHLRSFDEKGNRIATLEYDEKLGRMIAKPIKKDE